MFLIALLIGCATLVYIWLKWNYSYWKRNKVAGPEPTFLVGNIGPTFTFSEHWGSITANWYKEYENEPYVGYYKLLQPAILARDPELIKDVLITKFNSFRANDFKISKIHDPLTVSDPLFVKNDDWTLARRTALPIFSQLKIKSVFPTMNSVGEDFITFLRSYPQNTEFDAQKIFMRFTTENVIKSAFTIEPDCFNKENKSEFLKIGDALFTPTFLLGVKFFAMPILPEWAMDYIPAPFIPADVDQIFRDLVSTNKASRSIDHQSNDMFQALLQLQNKHQFDNTFLAGHAITLFINATETSTSTLSYAMYELAANPHVQEKLFDEISQTLNKYDGQLTFDGLQEMSYLEGVLMEVLRMHPPMIAMSKVCTQAYTLPKTSQQSEPITIQPGTVVNIPVMGIHMDPKYYPEPEQFMPERFDEESQRSRNKATFLGFGEGPRMCLGMRYASAQVKIAIIHIVKNFHIKPTPKQKPIVIDPRTLISYAKDGIFVEFETR